MITKGTLVKVLDNTGALEARCIGTNLLKYARVGDIITIAVQKAQPNKKVRRRQIFNALVVSTVGSTRANVSGFFRSFSCNGVILIKSREEVALVGSRINGVVSSDLRRKGFARLLSTSEGIF